MTFPAGVEAEVAERGEAELERWRAGLREDLEFATQPRFCYSHEWRDPPTHHHHHHQPPKLLESCFGSLLVALSRIDGEFNAY